MMLLGSSADRSIPPFVPLFAPAHLDNTALLSDYICIGRQQWSQNLISKYQETPGSSLIST